MTTHIMIDLETWGTEPGCDARSIGACVFDPSGINDDVNGFDDAGHYMKKPVNIISEIFHIALDNPIDSAACNLCYRIYSPNVHTTCPECGHDEIECTERRYPLTRDSKTVQWWSKQSDEARTAFTDPVDLRDGLLRFAEWLGNVSGFAYSMPEESDYKIGDIRLWAHGPQFDLSILASWYRAVGLPVPWHYRAPRDTRTIMEAAGMDPHKGLEIFSTGTYHNALDDAICQARAVCAAYKVIWSGQAAPDVVKPDPSEPKE